VKEDTRTDDDVLVRLNGPIGFVDLVDSWNLDEPSHVVREELVIDDPFCELIPLVRRAAVNANPPFHILMLVQHTMSAKA
jgi:poly-beta-hydroxyalkanoate depolymerase